MDKQLYGRTFSSKKEFLKWLEEHEDEIDWDYDVELSWYYKKLYTPWDFRLTG